MTVERTWRFDCAPGTPASFECFDVTGGGTVRGLGRVSLTTLPVDTASAGCPSGSFAVPGASMRLSVAGKGAIELRLDAATGCRTLATVLSHTRAFTVSGGNGRRLRCDRQGGRCTGRRGTGPVQAQVRREVPVGRTRVTCRATDASGNSRVARFVITVRGAR
jgi:hypothetical protein